VFANVSSMWPLTSATFAKWTKRVVVPKRETEKKCDEIYENVLCYLEISSLRDSISLQNNRESRKFPKVLKSRVNPKMERSRIKYGVEISRNMSSFKDFIP